jgi:hypothetical protein
MLLQRAPLTHENSERIFTGWLGKEEHSWRVVAGANTAYDKFPCQYQLYYPQKRGSAFWYDPGGHACPSGTLSPAACLPSPCRYRILGQATGSKNSPKCSPVQRVH